MFVSQLSTNLELKFRVEINNVWWLFCHNSYQLTIQEGENRHLNLSLKGLHVLADRQGTIAKTKAHKVASLYREHRVPRKLVYWDCKCDVDKKCYMPLSTWLRLLDIHSMITLKRFSFILIIDRFYKLRSKHI